MSNGLRCPECGSWYANDPSLLNGGYVAGEVCGNESVKGTNPAKCSPDHPCKGILEPCGRSAGEVVFDKATIKAAFNEMNDDDAL